MYKNILLISSLIVTLFASVVYAAETSETEKTMQTSEDAVVEEKKTTLEISQIWARKSMSPNNNSAAYMKINNPTDQQITVIGASATVVANNVELHESFVDDKGVSRMTSIDKIVVPARSEIELKPGGMHVMLFDLKRSLSAGDKFTIDIKIEGMDPISVESSVE
jgi:copper(I)-binding protein